MKKQLCTVYDQDHERDAEFLGVFQQAYTQEALMIGQVSGQIAFPVGVIILDGKLRQFSLDQIHNIRMEDEK